MSICPSKTQAYVFDRYIVRSKNHYEDEPSKKLTLDPFDLATVETKAKEMQLQTPAIYLNAPKDSHCVSMTLHFLKHMKIDGTPLESLQKIKKGTQNFTSSFGILPECEKSSRIYHNLFAANVSPYRTKKEHEEMLEKIQQCVASTIGLEIQGTLSLKMSKSELEKYLKYHLLPGKYLISLPGHALALFKDQNNEVFVFDPDSGAVQITHNEIGKNWFFLLLKEFSFEYTESLTLRRIEEKGNLSYFKSKEINPRPVTLAETPQKSKKWGILQAEREGKQYRFVFEKATGDIYNDDSKKLLRIKFTLLTLGRTLIDTAILTLYHTAMTITRLFYLAQCKLQGKPVPPNLTLKMMQSFYDIFRTPVYGLMMWGVASMGMILPYEGRKIYSRLAREYTRQQQTGINYRDKYYTAPCFNPINFKKEKNEAILETIVRFNRIHQEKINIPLELFCGWRRALPCFK